MQSPGDKGQCWTQGELSCVVKEGAALPTEPHNCTTQIFCSIQLNMFIAKNNNRNKNKTSLGRNEAVPVPEQAQRHCQPRALESSQHSCCISQEAQERGLFREAHELVLFRPLLTERLIWAKKTLVFYLKTEGFLPYLRGKKKKSFELFRENMLQKITQKL